LEKEVNSLFERAQQNGIDYYHQLYEYVKKGKKRESLFSRPTLRGPISEQPTNMDKYESLKELRDTVSADLKQIDLLQTSTGQLNAKYEQYY